MKRRDFLSFLASSTKARGSLGCIDWLCSVTCLSMKLAGSVTGGRAEDGLRRACRVLRVLEIVDRERPPVDSASTCVSGSSFRSVTDSSAGLPPLPCPLSWRGEAWKARLEHRGALAAKATVGTVRSAEACIQATERHCYKNGFGIVRIFLLLSSSERLIKAACVVA